MPDYDNNPTPYLRQSVTENPYRVLKWFVFLETIGPVKGLEILDVACGDGCLSRVLVEPGARSVLGTDISSTMIKRARTHEFSDAGRCDFTNLRFEVVDACDKDFTIEHQADLVTAMYLFHYASSEENLELMCQFMHEI